VISKSLCGRDIAVDWKERPERKKRRGLEGHRSVREDISCFHWCIIVSPAWTRHRLIGPDARLIEDDPFLRSAPGLTKQTIHLC
jgi:hypothetical protein